MTVVRHIQSAAMLRCAAKRRGMGDLIETKKAVWTGEALKQCFDETCVKA